MAYFLQQIANAVPLAALYAALAFGYALAFGLTRRADITYGAVFAFAGQIGLVFTAYGWERLFLVLPAALSLGALGGAVYGLAAGVVTGARVFRPLRSRRPDAVVVAGLGVAVVLAETARIAMDARSLWLPPFFNEPVRLFSFSDFAVTLTAIQLGNTVVFAAIVLFGHLAVEASRAGRIWRAVCDDAAAAALIGIDAGRVFVATFAAASLIATICGLLATAYYGTMDTGAGLIFGLKVVLLAAAGGHAVPARAALGAAGVGFAETLWAGYGPIAWRDPAIIGALVLLVYLSRRESVTI